MVRDGVSQAGALVRADQPWGDAQLAELYDAFFFDGDLPLYLELAREHGRKVLEIACGSGRVLVPLARAGCDVVGIDVSPHMLALAQAKLSGEHRARLIQADMRDFVLDEADFDVAIVAVKSFAYLTESDDQLSCLRRIHARERLAIPGLGLRVQRVQTGPINLLPVRRRLPNQKVQKPPHVSAIGSERMWAQAPVVAQHCEPLGE